MIAGPSPNAYICRVRPWIILLALSGCTKDRSAMTLEEQLRTIRKGETFPVPQLVPDGWMRSTKWEVRLASHVESSRPMGHNGPRCTAHGFLLTEEHTVLGIVAIECGGKLVPTSDGQLSTTWPLYAHPQNDLGLDLRFVDALVPDQDVLWVTETSVGDGYLTAMEYAYRIGASGRVDTILKAVGADPSAYADKTPDFNRRQADEVRASYRSEFRGQVHPKDFVILHKYREQPLEMRYVFASGQYEWDRGRPNGAGKL
jgi:hypothetical protein